MIFLVCVMLLEETHEIEPVEYTMILPGIVMDETIDADAEWFGLFEVDCGHYMLRPVELRLVQEEGIVYEGERPLGRLVELPGETDLPITLVSSSMPVYSAGPVSSVIDTLFPLHPDISFLMSSPGIESVDLDVNEEGVFISAPGISQHLTDTHPGTGLEGPFVDLVWAGDLDRDGKIDLLLNDVDNSYLIYNWVLFLSTEASRGQLVGRVASFYDVYY